MRIPSGKMRGKTWHARLGLVLDPAHVAFLEVVENRYVILAEERHVVIEILALEGVGHHGLVLHAGDVGVPRGLQGLDGSLHLPGRGVGARNG